ncbi:uncharacterized protein FIBRA_05224 [Fibroporia radiculosa]|uniref:ASTRA-associated protein 1 n=1 Tax=Fibroporia radiculosa TaxID=599839 RepID=J4H3D9_9APHY|nr:uncharacterized protein FIBRA_05224 [Fibroporia radiculosa]CCM03104.1 predicted protein [Fibroporia radiculosa]
MVSASKPPPPTPIHILRTHNAPLAAVSFSADNERLYSGDGAGTVVITNTRTLRPLAVWQAHTDAILGIQEWTSAEPGGERLVTHGRDNKLHVWQRVRDAAAALGHSAATPGLQLPQCCYSLDVNALNYCRFSLLCVAPDDAHNGERALIAVPNLVESSLADIWTLPGLQRLHAAIGTAGKPPTPAPIEGRGLNATGIIMGMHLFQVPYPHSSERQQLRLLCAYENGSVTSWGYMRTDKETSVEGVGWEAIWSVKLHVESGALFMAMAVSRDASFALTVSADHLIGRGRLHAVQLAESPDTRESACAVHRTKHPGNAAVAIRDDGRVCAVGGWDGRIRLYSTRSMKPLGTLDYYKKSCQAVAFARLAPHVASAPNRAPNADEDSEDEMGDEEKADRSRWLAAGGQDGRVTVWPLMSFGGSGT